MHCSSVSGIRLKSLPAMLSLPEPKSEEYVSSSELYSSSESSESSGVEMTALDLILRGPI